MFTVTRCLLGLLLAIRGIYFFVNIQPLYYLIKDSRLNEFNISMPLGMAISTVHMLGGIFLIIGLFTKISAAVQATIVLGAIIFINTHNKLSFTYPGLVFSLLVFALLLLFAVKGGGKYAVDAFVKGHAL